MRQESLKTLKGSKHSTAESSPMLGAHLPDDLRSLSDNLRSGISSVSASQHLAGLLEDEEDLLAGIKDKAAVDGDNLNSFLHYILIF
jgi:hypothetical protein